MDEPMTYHVRVETYGGDVYETDAGRLELFAAITGLLNPLIGIETADDPEGFTVRVDVW